MNMTFKLATGIAAVAIVAILGYNLLPRASSGVGGAPSIDGTWVTTFTKADLIASPLRVDDDEINDGNWGDFTLTFEDGQFSLALSNSVQSGTTTGTYTTDGDAIVMVFQTSPTVRETFGFRWSIANDVLTFQRDETVGAGPTPFLVKPWTRSS